MAGRYRWTADRADALSADAMGAWLLGHGARFDLSFQDARAHPQDFRWRFLWTPGRAPQDARVITTFADPANGGRRTVCALVEADADCGRGRSAPSLLLPVPLRAASVLAPGLTPAQARWRPPAGLDPAQTVVVGVIDDGINVTHARFRTGTGSRVDFAWLQGSAIMPATESVAGAQADRGGMHRRRRERDETALSTVPFGREWDRAALEAVTARHPFDEDARLAALGLADFARPGPRPAARRASHGTHVADIAAGHDPAEGRIDRRIVAVNLPPFGTWDTSGASLGLCVIAGVDYILQRARLIARTLGRPVPAVINLSFGISGGPHDGTHRVERAIDALLAAHEADRDGGPVSLVLPAGNDHLDRLHAVRTAAAGQAQTVLSVPWRVPPGDETSTWLEAWVPPAARDVQMTVTLPGSGGTITARDDDLPLVLKDGGAVVARLACDPPETGHGARRILLALVPTETGGSGHAPAPAGLWQVTVCARGLAAGQGVHLRIQRDISPIGYRRRGQQSWFDDPAYSRFDARGDAQQVDNAAPVRRAGTLNGYATGARPVVAGGWRLRDGAAASYSSAGDGVTGPQAAAVSDTSRVLAGILGAGTRSGSRLAVSGTSVAAPQVARLLADFLAGGDGCHPFDARAAVRELAAADEARAPAHWPAPDPARMGSGRLAVAPALRRQVVRQG